MPGFNVLNFRAKSSLILEIRQVDLQKIHFYEIAEDFYVCIISTMTHQNDVTTKRFRF